jgi:hypothetical protein
MSCHQQIIMTLLLEPLKLWMLVTIMVIAIVALTTELTQYEEIAKFVVIPSLLLLIILIGFNIIKTSTLR